MKRVIFFVLPLLLGGCTTTQLVSSEGMPAIAPMLSVERFLQASNARDLHGMARIFGSVDGPFIETGGPVGCAFKKLGSWFGLGDRCRTLQEVEIQMDVIANILQHEDYSISSEASVAGRVNPTTRIGVDFTIRGRNIPDVPFLVVKTGEGRWLVETIDLAKVMG
jgi:hypothetical protein